jgi:hypothetical protein
LLKNSSNLSFQGAVDDEKSRTNDQQSAVSTLHAAFRAGALPLKADRCLLKAKEIQGFFLLASIGVRMTGEERGMTGCESFSAICQ